MFKSISPTAQLSRRLVVATVVAVLSIVAASSLRTSEAQAAVTDRGCVADRTLGSSTPYQRMCTAEGDTWSNGYHFYLRVQQRQNYNFAVSRWVTWQVIEQAWVEYGGYWYTSVCKITSNDGVTYC